MPQALNTDWLNENILRNYPLVDQASRVAASGSQLPNGLLADLSLPVPVGTVAPDQVFIQQVTGFTSGLVISLAQLSAPNVVIASATVFVSSHQRFDSYALTGQGPLLGVVGRLTVGSPQAVRQAAASVYDYTSDPEASRLVVSTIRPLLRGLTGIQIEDSSGATSGVLSDVVTIAPGSNVQLEVIGTSLVINSQLTVTEAETEDDCGCDEDEVEGPFIKTINGIEPDPQGNFTLTGTDCLELEAIANGIRISDQCTEPCCGCEQLDVLYQAVQAVENESTRLQETGEQLRGRLDNLQSVLSNSQLNPPGGGDEDSDSGSIWYLPVGPGGGGGVWVTG